MRPLEADIEGASMRKISLITLAGMALGATAFGQSAATNSKTVTVEGCLLGRDGRYVVQEADSGKRFLLVGDNKRFANYVSQAVRVSGTPATTATSPNSVTTTDTSGANPNPGQPRINVSSVTKLSSSCSSPD
jgi:hypothetical protein